MALSSTYLFNHFELFGLNQVYLSFHGHTGKSPPFQTTGLYRFVRHPIMLGFLIAFWSTPVMTYGHLLFSTVVTAYIICGVTLAERDLIHDHGDAYARYRHEVAMFFPLPRFRRPNGNDS